MRYGKGASGTAERSIRPISSRLTIMRPFMSWGLGKVKRNGRVGMLFCVCRLSAYDPNLSVFTFKCPHTCTVLWPKIITLSTISLNSVIPSLKSSSRRCLLGGVYHGDGWCGSGSSDSLASGKSMEREVCWE